jgi:hypothetical protein
MVMFLRPASLLAILGLSLPAAADPGATSNWLMDQPVSMLTFGNYLMGEQLDAHLKDTIVGSVGANVTYDWASDRIDVYSWMHVQQAEFVTKANCRSLIESVKNRLGIDPSTGKPPEYPNYKPTNSNASNFYTQDGFSVKNEPKGLANQIDKLIVVHGLVQNTKDFAVPARKCQSPLLSAETMYSE